MSQCALVIGLSAAIVAASAASGAAQERVETTTRAFVDFNFGAQPQSRTATASSSFSLYDELATVTSVVPISHGAIFEIGAGYRVARNVAIAAAFSSFDRRSIGSLSASIPDSMFYGQPDLISSQTSALDHVERAIHIEAVWSRPVTNKLEIALSAGPSFIHVRQQLAAVAPPDGTTAAAVSTSTESGTALGANVGVETHYMFMRRFGLGVFVRYAAGSVDLPSVSGLKVGGFRTGAGFRLGL